jgi:hypothetical protein
MPKRDKKSVGAKSSGAKSSDAKSSLAESAKGPNREADFVRPAREDDFVRPGKDEPVFKAEKTDPVSRPTRETATPAPVRETAARQPAREEAQIRIDKEESARPVREDAPTKPAREDAPARAAKEEANMSARETSSASAANTRTTREQAIRREETIAVADNKRFIDKFDPIIYEEKYSKPVKSVVVNQDPAPGDFVPAGTPINLSFTIKESLPIESFRDVDKALTDKYQTIGAMMSDLTNTSDATAKEAFKVISTQENTDYTTLDATEKQKVDAYMRTRLGFEPNTNADKAKKVYSDMKFMNDL